MLVGSANWVVILGRFDIMYAVCSMARFNQVPREGLKAMLRVFGYLKGYAKTRILVDPTLPQIKGDPIEHNLGELYPNSF